MSLRFGLVLMLWLVTALAGLATLGWMDADAYRTAAKETRRTLERGSYALERNYHMEPRAGDPLFEEWTLIRLRSVMAPGTCVSFQQKGISQRRLCAGWQAFGEIPPAWFRKLNGYLFTLPPALIQTGSASQNGAFTLETSFDPVAAATLAWQRVRLALWQTLAMATGVLVLGTATILWRLGPVRGIVDELDRLAVGDLGARVEPGGAREFQKIARAVNRLAAQLRASAEQQRALTRKLLEVEDVERRQLARDLHDEFGQTLTATSALAASIAYAAPPDRADISRDADAIGTNVRRMMDTLRGAFARLRPPDLEEVGLISSLRTMLSGWETQRGARLILTSTIDETRLGDPVALDLYRIVQECVTNAMRHGTPKEVRVTLDQAGGGLRLTVADDGGGSLRNSDPGHGILGIRERVAAMGGTLDMTETGRGVQVAVTLPDDLTAQAA